jgi:hypothetical protein
MVISGDVMLPGLQMAIFSFFLHVVKSTQRGQSHFLESFDKCTNLIPKDFTAMIKPTKTYYLMPFYCK